MLGACLIFGHQNDWPQIIGTPPWTHGRPLIVWPLNQHHIWMENLAMAENW